MPEKARKIGAERSLALLLKVLSIRPTGGTMPYIKEICVAGKTIEVSKYYTARWGAKGEKRKAREERSSEAQKAINQRKAEKELRRIINTNFEDGDLLVRLDFARERAPTGSIDMQELIAAAVRKMRSKMRKDGQELKYVYVKEIGPRGGRHIHMVISKIDTDILRACWPHGGIHIDPLTSNGQYAKIAAYFVKYAARTEKTEGKLIGKRWYGSRNLQKPKIKKQVISSGKFRKEAKEKKGYYLDKESIRSGISEQTGYEFFSYTLIKTDKEGQG